MLYQMGRDGHIRRLHAFKTVSFVCWTFLLSYIPCIALWILKGLVGTHTINIPSDGVIIILRIATIMAMAINIVVNPVIYFYTNDKFAFFVRQFLTGNVKEFGRNWQNHVNHVNLAQTTGTTTNFSVTAL
jgi:ABC-type microcin C transport system permease subunit YejB